MLSKEIIELVTQGFFLCNPSSCRNDLRLKHFIHFPAGNENVEACFLGHLRHMDTQLGAFTYTEDKNQIFPFFDVLKKQVERSLLSLILQ